MSISLRDRERSRNENFQIRVNVLVKKCKAKSRIVGKEKSIDASHFLLNFLTVIASVLLFIKNKKLIYCLEI